MKIVITKHPSLADIYSEVDIPPNSIKSITIHRNSRLYPHGTIEIEADDSLTDDQVSQIKTVLGDAKEANKRLGKSIGGHVR